MEERKTNVEGLILKPVAKEDLSVLKDLLYELAVYEHLEDIFYVTEEILEESRFLLNYKFNSVSPMAVVLVGHTELWANKLKL